MKTVTCEATSNGQDYPGAIQDYARLTLYRITVNTECGYINIMLIYRIQRRGESSLVHAQNTLSYATIEACVTFGTIQRPYMQVF